MLQIDPKWGETSQSLLRKALQAQDKHLRERLLALALVASGEPRKSVAGKIGRHRNILAEWIKRFNADGVQGLVSGWKGNPGRILTDQELAQLDQMVSRHPREAGLRTGRWTAKLAAAFIAKHFGKRVSEETARQYLHLLGYRHKIPLKRLTKANPQQQRDFAQKLAALERERSPRAVTAYVDQGQIWQEALPRKGWFRKGLQAEVASSSPGKKRRSSMRP